MNDDPWISPSLFSCCVFIYIISLTLISKVSRIGEIGVNPILIIPTYL